MIIIFFILFILFYLLRLKENFLNNFNHPKLVLSCFTKNEINTFDYSLSKIIYGDNYKSICYLTPTKNLNEIPIISWNGYYINNFCVDKHYRRKGYGSSLLKKIITISVKEGKDHLILQVNNTNEYAKKMYYKFGFIEHMRGLNKSNNIIIYLIKIL
jgi:ribosomal protein S18 acetylase RimI-like enzyme